MNEKALTKILAVTSAMTGAIILIYILYPIVTYKNQSNQKYPILISPVVEQALSYQSDFSLADYTRASNWFVGGVEKEKFQDSKVSHYTISIPKLNIEKATVAIGGENLSESLIQYPGTSPPGILGNAVVFGHSILPQFYNPDDYLAIFSTLPTLERGDEISVYYDGVHYKYKVEDIFEVLPTDIQVLDQQVDDSYLSLITCTPPGHPLKPKRLIVRAKIVPLDI